MYRLQMHASICTCYKQVDSSAKDIFFSSAPNGRLKTELDALVKKMLDQRTGS